MTSAKKSAQISKKRSGGGGGRSALKSLKKKNVSGTYDRSSEQKVEGGQCVGGKTVASPTGGCGGQGASEQRACEIKAMKDLTRPERVSSLKFYGASPTKKYPVA